MKNQTSASKNNSTDIHKKRYHYEYLSSDTAFTPLGLFQVYQICDLAGTSSYTCTEHTQICMEITYIVSGKGVFTRNGTPYTVLPGNIFFVNVNDTHAIQSSKEDPIHFMNLGFAFNREHPDYPKYESIIQFFNQLENPLSIDHYNIFDHFSRALSEISTASPFSLELLEGYLRQIVIYTYRNLCNHARSNYLVSVAFNNANPLIYEIINYIDTSLMDIKKLSDISQTLGYSYPYLSNVFSQAMNLSIKDYYQQRRFEKAAKMLGEGHSIRHVSQSMHFSDDASFNKAFKKYYHITPGQYQTLIDRKNTVF